MSSALVGEDSLLTAGEQSGHRSREPVVPTGQGEVDTAAQEAPPTGHRRAAHPFVAHARGATLGHRDHGALQVDQGRELVRVERLARSPARTT